MFDHTVSRSLPMGVMKPIPVTATRRPLDLTFTQQRIRTTGPNHIRTGWENGGSGLDTKSKLDSDELAQVQRQLQPQAAGRRIEIAAEELAQLVQAVQDGMPVQVEGRGGILDRPVGEISLQRLEELLAAAGLGIQERPQGVRHEAFREHRVLGEDEVIPHLVLAQNPMLAERFVAHPLGPLLDSKTRSREQLLQTLEAYLANGSVKDAAAALNLHRHTVLYRLDKLRELLGGDFDVPASRLRLQLALDLRKLI